jgi:ATP-dependent RNA helicase RhlE
MKFTDLGLAEPLLRAVREQGYDTPTPIQAQAIPAVLQGGDLLAGAQTGTGKTAGFTLPLLHRLAAAGHKRDARGRVAIRALILTPTRELAAQVEERAHLRQVPAAHLDGDVRRRGHAAADRPPAQGRRHPGGHARPPARPPPAGHAGPEQVEIFVLDEADRMLDMGFIHDIKKVLAIVPAKKQSLLFSATFSDEIKALADRLLNAPGADRGGPPQCHRPTPSPRRCTRWRATRRRRCWPT